MQLRTQNLTKNFGDKCAVDHVSLTFERGVYGLLGPNGAGKTTLMRMLVDVLPPSSGKVTLDGITIGELGAKYRDILGYMPQEIGYYRDFTAKRFLQYLSALKGLDPRYANRRIDELLDLVGLADVKNKRLGQFSGGMIRRIGIAQALLNDPKILILDEPTAGLDPNERIRFRNILSELSEDRIVILSTHIVSDVQSIAGQVILLKEGKVINYDTTENLRRLVDGKVWLANVSHRELNELKQRFPIGNVLQKDDHFEIRIVSDSKPLPDATPADPSLEDVFVYVFGGEEE
ncbi:ABC transporter ATP-binding protein [Coprothermobacter platensis]|uniref:ABC transporter ATP-binding protein n=1 Tax=Coprothermobacter platensis TaxID=108819 RepID=UPI0003676C93|nr:ABC transporter ATP-binding protein [Coprothermobacter platensis]